MNEVKRNGKSGVYDLIFTNHHDLEGYPACERMLLQHNLAFRAVIRRLQPLVCLSASRTSTTAQPGEMLTSPISQFTVARIPVCCRCQGAVLGHGQESDSR